MVQAALVLLLVVAPTGSLIAQDQVVILQGTSKVRITGLIRDYTGQGLVIETNKTVRQLPRASLLEITTTYVAEHQAANRSLAEKQFAAAVSSFRKALEIEDRDWVRREILAGLIRCGLATGERAAAVGHYIALLRSDPETIYEDLLPAVWDERLVTPELALAAAAWLDHDLLPIQLIGGSVLLHDEESRPRARRALQRALASTVPSVQKLAQMQLYRYQLLTARISADDVERWVGFLEQLPEPLRGGPDFVVAAGFAKVGSQQSAAIHWLWTPLVQAADRPLAALGLESAADALEQIGQLAEAARLRAERASRFDDIAPQRTVGTAP